jgi:hypothetical protein
MEEPTADQPVPVEPAAAATNGKKIAREALANPDVEVRALVTEPMRPGVQGNLVPVMAGKTFKLPRDMAESLVSSGRAEIVR